MSDMFFVISNTEQRKTRNDKERKRKVKHKIIKSGYAKRKFSLRRGQTSNIPK